MVFFLFTLVLCVLKEPTNLMFGTDVNQTSDILLLVNTRGPVDKKFMHWGGERGSVTQASLHPLQLGNLQGMSHRDRA